MLSHNNHTANCITTVICFYLSGKHSISLKKWYTLLKTKFIRHTDVFVMIFTGNNNYEFELIFRHVHACYRSIEEMKN